MDFNTQVNRRPALSASGSILASTRSVPAASDTGGCTKSLFVPPTDTASVTAGNTAVPLTVALLAVRRALVKARVGAAADAGRAVTRTHPMTTTNRPSREARMVPPVILCPRRDHRRQHV